ncbi:MAG: hypothetical protein U0Q12_12855 [Vicinamibacterales bacterium]
MSLSGHEHGESAHAGACPFAPRQPESRRPGLQPDDELALPWRKRMVVQYAPGDAGGPELHLYYGDKEVAIDDPALFGFGETLAAQSRFRAGDASQWGAGQNWAVVKGLLEHLLAEGIVRHAGEAAPSEVPTQMVRPAPLQPGPCPRARTWAECESITRELAGRAVEPGYLEMLVPVFRVAHIYVDADGRQVGEANVFPPRLRLDRPTTWLTCAYPGTRHMSDRPMNVTALKAMRLHWRQMMAALIRIREAFLRRFPDASEGWTVGRVERLATLVLSVPTYQLVRCDRPLSNGELHPALSSLFRVTDGLRMTMHQMLFVPIGEPALSPDTPLTSERIFEYAERNYSFHSEHGVCGGPKHMIQEFLRVVLDGEGADAARAATFEPPVEAALADIDAAFDYGLHGLQVYGAFFSLWPAMTRTYAHLWEIADAAVRDGWTGFAEFRDRLRGRIDRLRANTYLATEEWRAHRERVYTDMYETCGRGLSAPRVDRLADELAPRHAPAHDVAARKLAAILAHRFGCANDHPHVEAIGRSLMDFFVRTQSILRASCAVQARLNRLLARPMPTRAFTSADADVHNRLRGTELQQLPYLIDELADALRLGVDIDADRVDVIDLRGGAPASR